MLTSRIRKKPLHLTPTQTIMVGFAIMILMGAILLNTPLASRTGERAGFAVALFTATSASCVIGLLVVNTASQWSWFGQLIILLLIQFGSLGFVTVSTVAMMLTRRRVSLRNRQVIQASFNLDSIGGMVRLVKTVVHVTVAFEAAGAVLLAVAFYASTPMGIGQATYNGIFHSVSAFCNAGFDILGDNSLVKYCGNVPVNAVVMALAICGGLGFTVWEELIGVARHSDKRLRSRLKHMSLHSKITLNATAILLFTGSALFLLLEWDNPSTLGGLPVGQRLQAALFQSSSLRTVGFYTVEPAGLNDASKALACVFMLIGGSSASTAGGMKTITLAVIVIAMLSVLRGSKRMEAFGRTLPQDILMKALTVVSAMLAVVFTSALLLHFTEKGNPYPHSFFDLIFESCSAAGTVGLTTGITPHLSAAGKAVITVCMYLGRLSPMTVVFAMNNRLNKHGEGITYPKERVIIG